MVVKSLKEFQDISHNVESKYELRYLLHPVKIYEFIINMSIWANDLCEINLVNIEIKKILILCICHINERF